METLHGCLDALRMQSLGFVYALDHCQLCLQLNDGCNDIRWSILLPEQRLLIMGAQHQCYVAVPQAALRVV